MKHAITTTLLAFLCVALAVWILKMALAGR